jgi:hypothetical protein
VTYGELEDWAQSDKTLFHSGQLKTALREMEGAGLLEGDPATRTSQRLTPNEQLESIPASLAAQSTAPIGSAITRPSWPL